MRKLVPLSFILIMALSMQVYAQGFKSRDEIPDKYKWNLSDIYPTLKDWQKHKETFPPMFEKVSSFRETLQSSAKQLREALDYIFDVRRNFDKLGVYASMLSDLDTREALPMAMNQELKQMWTVFNSKTSYLEPEILSIPQEKMGSFFIEEPGLKVYGQYIDNIQRMKAHTLNAKEESIIAQAGLMAGTASGIHNLFTNADLEWEKAKLTDGTEMEINEAAYIGNRGRINRQDRIAVFNGFFNTLRKYRRTFGAMLYGKIKENMFFRNVRNYDSILEMALDGNNIPASVYTNLIENNHRYLPLLHRYLKIRKRMLGVEELHYYDFYPDLVPGVEIRYSFDEATKIFKDAVKVLGEEYMAKLDEAFANRWIDVYPAKGKASGNYSNGPYDIHPYVFLNFTGRYPDLSMLSHEMGHAVHSCYSNKNQPYATSNYSSFVAEVGSTTNETLLVEYVIHNVKDPKQKLALLGSFLEGMRQTVFRQTLFAEYELLINQLAEKGESLTGDRFTELYLDLLKKYYGHKEGIAVIDDIFGNEWCYISHFFLGFYNYQYATSYAAALALAEKMLSSGQEMVDKYIQFLSSGNSKYPIDLLKDLGIDMTTTEPFDLAMQKMSKALDEMEKLLDSLGM